MKIINLYNFIVIYILLVSLIIRKKHRTANDYFYIIKLN